MPEPSEAELLVASAEILKQLACWAVHAENLKRRLLQNPLFSLRRAWAALNPADRQSLSFPTFQAFLRQNRVLASPREARLLLADFRPLPADPSLDFAR